MLAYFPTVYPDELLYSLLARFHRHLGSPSPMHTMEMLFGRRVAIASIDFQGFLPFLANVIPSDRNLTVERLIDTLTICPYYLAFSPPLIQREIRRDLASGTTENIHLRLGITAFRIPSATCLRFCPECRSQMLQSQGELYWRRSHQLPSVLVCPSHGCRILESKVSLSREGRHRFVAATPENCPTYAQSISAIADDLVNERLHQIAIRSAELLDTPPDARTCSGWVNFYKSKMKERGLSRSDDMLDQRRLETEFRSYFGSSLHIFPHVLKDDLFEGDWLASIVRRQRSSVHPQYHLLIQQFLEGQQLITSPFGQGPWPCLNPLVDHEKNFPIKTIQQHNNHGKRVAVFTCRCGYVYTRYYDAASKKLGSPRFLKYGPLFEPTLRKLVENGVSLRSASRIFRLDPKTVIRLSKETEVRTRWGNQEPANEVRKQIRRKRKETPKSTQKTAVASVNMKKRIPRRNWSEIDDEWMLKVNRTILNMRDERPPVRITLTGVERRTDGCGWISKRRAHLPKTMGFLLKNVETVAAFRIRRVRLIIHEQEQIGNFLRPWEIMRKAGLRSDSLAWIALEIGVYRTEQRAA